METSQGNAKTTREFSDALFILVKWRKLILVTFIIVCAITATISFIVPKWYKVECSILPPENEGLNLGGFSSLMSMLPGGAGGMELPLLATPSDVFASILRSRNIQSVIIKKHNLNEVFEIDTIDETILALSNIVNITVGDEGIIYLSVETKDKKLSLNIAKSYIEELDRVNREKRKTKAKEMRQFIENRLVQNKTDLRNAENTLKTFQESNQLVSVEEQTRATISIATELTAELQLKKVELGMLKSTLRSSHSEIKMLESNIRELDKQIALLGFGKTAEAPNSTKKRLNTTIPINEIPNLGLQYLRLLREVKIQEAIFELIMQQYEQAKIQEKRDTPTIQVLDSPMLPEIKSKPQRRVMVMVAGFMSLVLSIIFVFIIEYFREIKEKNPAGFLKYEQSYQLLKHDFNWISRKNK